MRQDTRDMIGRDLLPVFLGSTSSAHRLALCLAKRYGTVSLIADRKRTFLDLVDPATRFLSLPASGDARLTAELLNHLCDGQRDAFPLLIPCKEEYRLMAEAQADRLESHFILVDERSLLGCAPIADFPL